MVAGWESRVEKNPPVFFLPRPAATIPLRQRSRRLLRLGDHRLLSGERESNPDSDRSVGACEINRETIAHELERSPNAAGSLVQNLRAGFVPPEPPNRTSGYFATATRVSGDLGQGSPGDSPILRGEL